MGGHLQNKAKHSIEDNTDIFHLYSNLNSSSKLFVSFIKRSPFLFY